MVVIKSKILIGKHPNVLVAEYLQQPEEEAIVVTRGMVMLP